MKFHYKRDFLKRLEKHPKQIQKLIVETDKEIKNYLLTQSAAWGLRIKKIGPNTYEARVNEQIRVVWVKDKDMVTFSLIGNHEEIRQFIKNI